MNHSLKAASKGCRRLYAARAEIRTPTDKADNNKQDKTISIYIAFAFSRFLFIFVAVFR